MTEPHDDKGAPDQKKIGAEKQHPEKESRAMELGEQAEHAIGPRKENLIEKAKQESP